MGLDLTWMAVKGRGREALLDRLDFEDAGEASDELSADCTCATLPGGWVVLVATCPRLPLDEALITASAGGFAIGCQVMDTVSFNQARGYRDGRLAWSVTRDPDVHPDELQIEGEPPPEFAEIKRRLQAGQAASDLPLELAASICGYRVGESRGLEWTVLRKKRPAARHSARRPRSLSGAIRSELLPLLKSLGWELANDRPGLADPNQIHRRINGLTQTIWFEFESGRETYIIVHFWAADVPWPDSTFSVGGHVAIPRMRLPVWKRFTWARFRTLAAAEPPPKDVIDAVIEQARQHVIAADAFLTSGEPNAWIHLERRLSKGRWPSAPLK